MGAWSAAPRVAVIIPAWNEAESIGRVLAEVPADVAERVVVVDGGSSDATADVARRAGAEVVPQVRRGYGAACWTGVLAAPEADVLVFLDGDYSDPPASIPDVLRPVVEGRADLALGQRAGAASALPWHARAGNRAVALLIGLLYHQRVSDLPSLKAIRRDLLRRLDMSEMTYGWTVEMIVKAASAGARVVEVPVPYRRRAGGRSKVSGNLRASALAGYHLVATALRYCRWQPER
jgi:glycosyltransferase involved in cell wall biosynthesis